MFTLIDTEKACNKVQHPFMTKTLNKVPHPFMIKALTIDTDLEGTYLNIVKSLFEKPTANIILSGEKLRAFPQGSGIRQECPLSPLLFSVILEVLATAVRQPREIKGI